MSETATMTVRLDKDLKNRLNKLAVATKRSKSFLAVEAIKEFLDLSEWQIKEIEAGIKEADAGEFATDKEVKEVFGKWTDDAR